MKSVQTVPSSRRGWFYIRCEPTAGTLVRAAALSLQSYCVSKTCKLVRQGLLRCFATLRVV